MSTLKPSGRTRPRRRPRTWCRSITRPPPDSPRCARGTRHSGGLYPDRGSGNGSAGNALQGAPGQDLSPPPSLKIDALSALGQIAGDSARKFRKGREELQPRRFRFVGQTPDRQQLAFRFPSARLFLAQQSTGPEGREAISKGPPSNCSPIKPLVPKIFSAIPGRFRVALLDGKRSKMLTSGRVDVRAKNRKVM